MSTKSQRSSSINSIIAFVENAPCSPADKVLAITNGLALHDIKPEQMGPKLAALLAHHATAAALDLTAKLQVIEALKYNVAAQQSLFSALPTVFQQDLQDSEVEALLDSTLN